MQKVATTIALLRVERRVANGLPSGRHATLVLAMLWCHHRSHSAAVSRAQKELKMAAAEGKTVKVKDQIVYLGALLGAIGRTGPELNGRIGAARAV